MSLPPWLVLAAVVALAFAAVYQLAAGRIGWRILIYWMFILGGALMAEAVAEHFGWNVTRVGDLRTIPDMVGAIGVMSLLWLLRL